MQTLLCRPHWWSGLTSVGYTRKSKLVGVAYTGESRLPGVGYTWESIFTGVQYSTALFFAILGHLKKNVDFFF